jgi:4-amino-4-deoxy-L-arabinose transferase-like glycosyltransferase
VEIIKREKVWISSIKRLLTAIIVFGVISKLIIMIMTQSWKFEDEFSFAYEAGEIGASLAMGNGYSWITEKEHHQSKANESTSWEAPIYPFIIAAVFKMFGIFSTPSAVVLIIFQIVISAMICVMLFLIGRHVFNDWTGVLAALLFVLNPSAMHFIVQKIYTTPFYILFLLLFIYQLLKLAEFPSPRRSILTGVICGIGILCVPIIIAFLPFALGWLLLRGKGEFKPRGISVCIIVLTISITISPWQIRNYIIFDRFIPVRSNLGRELFLGNYGKELLGESAEKQLKTADEGKRSAIYEKAFIKSLMDAPKIFFQRFSERVKTFWTALPRNGGPYKPKTGSLSELALGAYYLFILLLGVAGICITRLKNSGIQLLALGLLSLPIPFYLTWFSRFRYRFPVEVLLTIFASYSIYCFWKLFCVKRRAK